MVASSIAVLLSVFSVVRTNSILEVSYYYYYFTFQFFQNCEGSFIFHCLQVLIYLFRYIAICLFNCTSFKWNSHLDRKLNIVVLDG